MTALERQRCDAAGCAAMETADVEYTDTFDGDCRKTMRACLEHAAVLVQRDLAAAALRWIRAHMAVGAALAALEAKDPQVVGTAAADVHLKALQEYLDSYAVVEVALTASNNPAVKAGVAAMDEEIVTRINGLLTLALSLRRPSGEDPGA